jgi:hypothetical protein
MAWSGQAGDIAQGPAGRNPGGSLLRCVGDGLQDAPGAVHGDQLALHQGARLHRSERRL